MDGEKYKRCIDALANGEDVRWNEFESNALQIRSPSSPKSLEKSLLAIREGAAGLTKTREMILSRVPESGDYHRFKKGKISIHDLAYLSAATGHEFSLFRGKNEDMLFHGTTYACDVEEDIAEELIRRGYEWIAHSHIDMGNLISSIADRETLRKLNQQKSIIIGPTGKEIEFYQSEFY